MKRAIMIIAGIIMLTCLFAMGEKSAAEEVEAGLKPVSEMGGTTGSAEVQKRRFGSVRGRAQ